jgi:hypothetical protein
MPDAPKPGRTWVKLVVIALVVMVGAFLVLLVTDGGGLFDYDTF